MHPRQVQKKVAVLLATFNGEAYLRQQIESLLTQSCPISRIYVRDDASTDGTVAILREYGDRYPEVFVVIEGHNLGFVGNFFSLISHALVDADYYFLCDQDDVWLPHKVERAMAAMEEIDDVIDNAVMYFGRLYIVDERLQILGLSSLVRKYGFGNALFENLATGCTIAWNRKGMTLVQGYLPDASRVIAHDWWLYLLFSAWGRVVYDHEPEIYYRQHGGNQLGASHSFLMKMSRRIRGYFTGAWHSRRPERMLQELRKMLGETSLGQEKNHLLATALGELPMSVVFKLWGVKRFGDKDGSIMSFFFFFFSARG